MTRDARAVSRIPAGRRDSGGAPRLCRRRPMRQNLLMDRGDLITFTAYMRWSQARLLEMIHDISAADWARADGGSFGSLCGTLTHMLGAERIWAARLRGETASMPAPGEFSRPTDLAAAWRRETEALSAWAEGLPAGPVTASLSYRDLKGRAWTTPVAAIFLHLTQHQAYHRGQAIQSLRRLGCPVRATDFIVFERERQAGNAGPAS